ncbi:Flp family type IVb pilin [uncultured Methylobacterium sp.]|uniref:Flp family type IVb pilin n=1 Tax=uncultured Methylobacterium sp. TaxID=157278 RepID=UPI0035C9C938
MPRPAINQKAEPRGGGSWERLRWRFTADSRGATSIEYAMIGGLIFVVIAGSLRLYSSRVSNVYTTIGNAISQAG